MPIDRSTCITDLTPLYSTDGNGQSCYIPSRGQCSSRPLHISHEAIQRSVRYHFNCHIPCLMYATATTIRYHFNCRIHVSCMRLRRQFDITSIVASLSHVCDCDDNSISLQLSHPCLMFVTATTIGILSDNIEDPVLRQMMREEEEQKARELRIKVGRCRC